MKIIFSSFLILLFIFNFETARSHSGGTNAEGCHNNRKTGDYHCHNPKKKNKNSSSKTLRFLKNKNTNFKCESKRVCADMDNCKEAKFVTI